MSPGPVFAHPSVALQPESPLAPPNRGPAGRPHASRPLRRRPPGAPRQITQRGNHFVAAAVRDWQSRGRRFDPVQLHHLVDAHGPLAIFSRAASVSVGQSLKVGCLAGGSDVPGDDPAPGSAGNSTR